MWVTQEKTDALTAFIERPFSHPKATLRECKYKPEHRRRYLYYLQNHICKYMETHMYDILMFIDIPENRHEANRLSDKKLRLSDSRQKLP